MRAFETLLFEQERGVGTVWLNRPEKRNAMNETMISELISCFESLNDEPDIRIVVLRAKGKSFCAGADISYMKDIASYGLEQNYRDSLHLARCFNTIYNCSKPCIALVHGAAIGGANGLIAASDISFCENNTTFAFAEVKLGITPATISPYVIKRIGEYNARELMLTGRRFKGEEAQSFGLVNKSLPEEKLEEELNSIIKHLKTSAPGAMKACKELIYSVSSKLAFGDALDYTANLIAELRASEEGQEGLQAFLEKRKAKWMND